MNHLATPPPRKFKSVILRLTVTVMSVVFAQGVFLLQRVSAAGQPVSSKPNLQIDIIVEHPDKTPARGVRIMSAYLGCPALTVRQGTVARLPLWMQWCSPIR